jgi:hypothetical protein
LLSSFLGVADFFAAGFFALDAVFFGAAFLVPAADAFVFVTRPDLVFPSTTGLSSTAGAGAGLRLAAVLAFGFAAFLVVVLAFFSAAGFFALVVVAFYSIIS